jgi:hypothetical protein
MSWIAAGVWDCVAVRFDLSHIVSIILKQHFYAAAEATDARYRQSVASCRRRASYEGKDSRNQPSNYALYHAHELKPPATAGPRTHELKARWPLSTSFY